MFRGIFKYAVFILILGASASAMQTTIWVDKDLPGDDLFGAGTQSDPYATISKAVLVANQNPTTAYIIKVVEGDYTQAYESSSPVSGAGYPIEIERSDIRIEGASTDPAYNP